MAYKDPQEEKEYQHNYYERTKKLKGRRRTGGLGGLTRATSSLGSKSNPKQKPKPKKRVKKKSKTSIRKQAVQRKLRSIADQWARMSKSQKKQSKSKFLKKLNNLKKKIKKLYGGKSKKRIKVATDTSGKTLKSKGLGNVSGLNFGNVDEILASIKNTEVKTAKPNPSVSKLLNRLLKKTGTKLVNKSKSTSDLEGGRR